MEPFLTKLTRTTKQLWTRPALTNYHGETFTHHDVAVEIEKLHIFYREIGVKTGDRIALAAGNSARWAIAFMSALTHHAVAVPILSNFTPDNIQKLVNHAEASLIFTDKATFERMTPEEMPTVTAIVDCDYFELLWAASDKVTHAFENRLENFKKIHPEGLFPSDIHYPSGYPDELVIINYTSGTTGTPKGIMVPSRSITSNVEFALTTVHCSPEDKAICMLPMGHMYGLIFEFFYTYIGGCHVHFLTRMPSPSVVLKAFSEIRPYIFITVPLVVEKIIQSKVIPVLKRPWMKTLTNIPFCSKLIYGRIRKQFMQALGGRIREIPIGGAPINPEVEKILVKAGIPISVGYGMTECAPLIAYSKWNDFRIKSCGKAVDRMEIRIDSRNPRKVIGEIQVKGMNVMMGYYKNPEATEAAFTEDGWMRTGDLGLISRKGFVYIKGRSKFMILSSNGQNIYPEDLEAHLNAQLCIAESLVVERNKKLVALVSLIPEERGKHNNEQFAEEIRQEANLTLPAYEQISKVEILDGEFEHTPKLSIKRYLYS